MNDTYIIDKLQKFGMTLAGAVGTWANICKESGGNPKNVEDRSGIPDETYTRMVDAGGYDFSNDKGMHYGYGLAQWTASFRKDKLLAFAKKRGCSVGNIDMQLEFLCKEMKEDFPHVWKVCSTDNDPWHVAYFVCKFYEIPADTERRATERAEYAKQYYEKLNAAPVASPAKTEYWPPRTVDKNMSGADVEVLQAILKARGYGINYISGKFDDLLDGAVRSFQEDNGLTADGVVGPLTWAKLLERR